MHMVYLYVIRLFVCVKMSSGPPFLGKSKCKDPGKMQDGALVAKWLDHLLSTSKVTGSILGENFPNPVLM